MLGFGALGEFALADFGDVALVVSVALPTVNLALVLPAPRQAAGKSFGAPVKALTLHSFAGGTITGRLVGLPVAALSLSTPLPKVLPGKLIDLPLSALGWAALTPNVQTGRVISLTDTVTVSVNVGTLAGGALGEFSIGEGDVVTATFTIPVRLKLGASIAALQAGKNFAVPLIPIVIHTPPPEPDARARAIRINAIAS